MVRFEDPSALLPVGGGCYRADGDARPIDADAASVHQGCLENSNVSSVQELVRLIAITRLYQANAKAIESMDERSSQLLRVAMGS